MASRLLQLLPAALMTGVGASCATEPPVNPSVYTDRSTYLAALDVATGTPAQRLKWCRTITDPWMRGDCAHAVVQPEASRSVRNAQAWCPQHDDSKWLHECYFVAAEAVATVGDAKGARELCAQSGPHESSCSFHLYQLEVERAVWQASADVLEAQATLVALGQEHNRPDTVPGSETIRQNWYTKVAFRHEITDAMWCAPLTDLHRTDCEKAVWKVLHSVATRGSRSGR